MGHRRRRSGVADAVPAHHHALPVAGAAAGPGRDSGLPVLQPGPGPDPAADPDGTGRLPAHCLVRGARGAFRCPCAPRRAAAVRAGGPAHLLRPDPGGAQRRWAGHRAAGVRRHGGPLRGRAAAAVRGSPVFRHRQVTVAGAAARRAGGGARSGFRRRCCAHCSGPRRRCAGRSGSANGSGPPWWCRPGPPRCSGWTTWNASWGTNSSPWYPTSCRCRLWALPCWRPPAGCWEAAPRRGPCSRSCGDFPTT